MINTVLGSIEAKDLGVTMIHEHLAPREAIPEFEGGTRFVEPYGIDTIVEQLLQAKKYGLDSIVDCTPYGMDRNVSALQTIAKRTGVNIIASTGFYKEPNIPAFAYQASVDELTNLMIRELTEQIDGKDCKAGIIKVGSSMREVNKVEEKIFRAAARAHRETGTPITTHATLGTAGLDQVKILADEGVDFGKVVIGHTGLNSSFSYHKLLASYGALLGFDTIGKERFDYVRIETAGVYRFEFEKEAYYIQDNHLVESIKALIDAGLVSQIVLSSDITRRESYINTKTFGSYGYSYLLHRFLPMLRDAGVTEEEIQEMMVANPRRLLDIG